jgi:serine/threonine-protein kinase
LESAQAVILANGWSNETQIAKAKTALMRSPEPAATAGRSRLAQFLLEQKILTREQALDLDSIVVNQKNLPNFQLLKKLGSGGMGVVYLAKHIASGRTCALKTINARLADDGDFVNRFHRETEALSAVRHDHIAEVIETGEREGHFYLAMEFIDGPSLMALLKDYHALPELYSLRIVRQIADGLGYVYTAAGLIHRDLKPENVLIVRSRNSHDLFPEDDVAKLIDFGLVKSMDDKDERLTQTGMTIGTPLYMSPEQVRGEALDCRSDIYGLGATLYHLVTGTTPYNGSSPGTIMSAHLTQPIPDPSAKVPSLNPLTRSLIMTAMAKDVGDRFLNYDGLIKTLDKAIGALAGQTAGAPKLLLKPLVLKGAAAAAAARKNQGTDRTTKDAAAAAKADSDRVAKPAAPPAPAISLALPEDLSTLKPLDDSGVREISGRNRLPVDLPNVEYVPPPAGSPPGTPMVAVAKKPVVPPPPGSGIGVAVPPPAPGSPEAKAAAAKAGATPSAGAPVVPGTPLAPGQQLSPSGAHLVVLNPNPGSGGHGVVDESVARPKLVRPVAPELVSEPTAAEKALEKELSDAKQAAQTSVLPWIILGVAVACLVAWYFLMR